MTPPSVAETIDAVWRIESARLIAGLARIVGDIGVAEDLAQDALVAALEQWPDSGIPDNPGAWLMGTAKPRAVDYLRRGTMQAAKHEQIGRALDEQQQSPEAALADAMDDHVGDDLLRLIFTTCHPVLPTKSRGHSWYRRPRFNNGSCGPSARSRRRVCRSKFHPRRSWRIASSRCSRAAISFSMKATRRLPAKAGCGRRSVTTRSVSVASLPSWRRRSRKSTGSSR